MSGAIPIDIDVPIRSGVTTRAAKHKLKPIPANAKRKRDPTERYTPPATFEQNGSKRAIKESKRLSFREALAKYSTPLLWSWLLYDEKLASHLEPTDEWRRDMILNMLVSPARWRTGCDVPDLEDLQKVWTAANPGTTTPVPGMYDAVWDTAQQIRYLGQLPTPYDSSKRQKVTPAAATSAANSISINDDSDDDDDEYDDYTFEYEANCLSCGTAYSNIALETEGSLVSIKCTDPLCGMIANRSPDDTVNVRRAVAMAQQLGSTRASSSASAVGTTPALTPKPLAKNTPTPIPGPASTASATGTSGESQTQITADTFFRAIAGNTGQTDRTHASALAEAAKAGAPYPRFEETMPISARALVDSIHDRSFDGSAYTRPSDALLSYIRSGKLVDVGFALPLSVEAREETTRRSNMGGLSALMDGVKLPPVREVTSMSDYMCALISTILPALIEQPAALSDWLTLTRSMLELERRTAQRGGDGWKTAQSYMQRMLQRHVARRDSFGNNDLEIVNQLLLDGAFSSQAHNRSHGTAGANAPSSWSNTSSKQAAARGSGPGSGSGKPLSAAAGPRSPEPCHHFNDSRGCHKQVCRYTHICSSCKGNHSVTACSKGSKATASKPAAAAAASSSSSA